MQEAVLPSDYWEFGGHVQKFIELNNAISTVNRRDDESVYSHTMNVMDYLPIKNSVTLLAALFHDLGKCRIKLSEDPEVSKFHGHEIRSVKIVCDRLREWGASEDLVLKVMRLVVTHMYDIKGKKSDKAIRRFIAAVGVDNIENWFSLRYADSAAYDNNKEYRCRLIEPFQIRVMSFLQKQPNGDEFELANPGDSGNMRIEGKDTE